MARFLFVGDIHFESIKNYFPDNHLSLISDTLLNIWKYGRENGVTNVIIGGDVFDTPYPRDEAKQTFLKTLDRNLNYHIILGNHDYASVTENSFNLCKYFVEDLGLMDNVKFYTTPQTVTIDDVNFDMLPFPATKPLSPNSVCVGHFQVKGYCGDNGRRFTEGNELDDDHIWLLGHLHKQQGKLYPGSIVQTKFGESVGKFFFDCKTDGREIKIKRVSITPLFKLLDLVVTSLDDLNQLEEGNCYRLFVANHLDNFEIQKRTNNYNIWQIKGLEKQLQSKSVVAGDLKYEPFNMVDQIQFLKAWLSQTSLNETEIEKAVRIVEKITSGEPI